MRTFSYMSVTNLGIDEDIIALLTQIHEYKGKQELYLGQQPEVLEKLTTIAKIQSVDASNRIEGIVTSNARLMDIMSEKSKPSNRAEEEIAGYREVLSLIHEAHDAIDITPNIILALHKKLYSFAVEGLGGFFKQSDNSIEETDEMGVKSVRFSPVPAFLTPIYMEALCNAWGEAKRSTKMDALLTIPCFILDFLCIHPFRDGNGRISRLLMLLLLYQAGFLAGKFISIEKIIENTKESYYETLHVSSEGWHDGRNDYKPFLRYTLGVILKTYRDFEERYQVVFQDKVSSKTRIFDVINNSAVPLKKSELLTLCPEFKEKTIEVALGDLVREDKIIKVGQGRSTAYKVSLIPINK